MIFESPGSYPSLEELVLCDMFRNIDLREMRGSFVPVSCLCLAVCSISLINQSFSVVQTQSKQFHDEFIGRRSETSQCDAAVFVFRRQLAMHATIDTTPWVNLLNSLTNTTKLRMKEAFSDPATTDANCTRSSPWMKLLSVVFILFLSLSSFYFILLVQLIISIHRIHVLLTMPAIFVLHEM